MHEPNPPPRRVRLFRNNRNQAVRIPVEFELPGQDALIHREGDRLIIEPAPVASLLDLIAGWDPLEEPFPDVDETLLPLPPVTL